MKSARLHVPGTWVCDYQLRTVEQPSQLIVLLHGYQQSGPYLFGKLESSLPKDAILLSPSGPFPMPIKRDSGEYRAGYSWYFYDFKTDEYFIDMETGIEYVKGVIEKLGFSQLPTTLIGFSQGGYLAPFLAQRLKQVKQVVGIACRFLDDELNGPWSFRLDQIQGASDEIVSADEAEESHRKLIQRGAIGEFRKIPGVEHKITSEVLIQIQDLLSFQGK